MSDQLEPKKHVRNVDLATLQAAFDAVPHIPSSGPSMLLSIIAYMDFDYAMDALRHDEKKHPEDYRPVFDAMKEWARQVRAKELKLTPGQVELALLRQLKKQLEEAVLPVMKAHTDLTSEEA